ncbi:hypothetical protein [Amycolatopsis sp., V23-08]|uniref:hypothetical protein n=1 Tax=Amycolatopsis heterodermiae TaxID=3110235 RepID=UPI002B1FC47B|nr:hypothetical protein [Amycolatopsis sp., V23-08]
MAESPQRVCRYHWRPGVIAVWDNRATRHYVVNDYTGRRASSRAGRTTREPPTRRGDLLLRTGHTVARTGVRYGRHAAVQPAAVAPRDPRP